MRIRFTRIAFTSLALLTILSADASGAFRLPQDRQDQPQEPQSAADEYIAQGVEAYKRQEFEQASLLFQKAKDADASSVKARLYLATSYSARYIPGSPEPENVSLGKKARDEFRSVVEMDPANLSALDGLGSILYLLGGQPFNPQALGESRDCHLKHIALKP
jgi:Tfp pilus assembly protein PilF